MDSTNLPPQKYVVPDNLHPSKVCQIDIILSHSPIKAACQNGYFSIAIELSLLWFEGNLAWNIPLLILKKMKHQSRGGVSQQMVL